MDALTFVTAQPTTARKALKALRVQQRRLTHHLDQGVRWQTANRWFLYDHGANVERLAAIDHVVRTGRIYGPLAAPKRAHADRIAAGMQQRSNRA